MARHRNETDVETDEAPSVGENPHMPNIPMNGTIDSNGEPLKYSKRWSEPIPTTETWSPTSCEGPTTSVSTTVSCDSGIVTTAESSKSRMTSCVKLTSLFDNLCLSCESTQAQSSLSSRCLQSRDQGEAAEPSSKETGDYSKLITNLAFIKANPDICLQQDEDGDSLLHLAVLTSQTAYVLVVLQAAMSSQVLHLKNTLSQTALHLAILRRNPRIVRLLVANGAPVDACDRNGNTALHLACREGDLDCVKQLTTPLTSEETARHQHGFQPCILPQNPNVRNYQGDSCLHLAAAGGHVDVVKHLIEGPTLADVNFPDGRSGRTVLHHVAESRDMTLLSFLLQHRFVFGLDLDAQAYCGNTALNLAQGRNYNDVVEFLVLAGADISGHIPSGDPLNCLSSSFGTSSSCSDLSMDSEDFDDHYDDFCLNGRPVHNPDRISLMFSHGSF